MQSVWTDSVNFPNFDKLKKDIRTDVLIIGGGITGLLCAYQLHQARVDYVLVEAEQDPAIANPFEYALKARKYIAEKAGL